MAKKTEAPKKVLERTYVVPLRKEWRKAPKYKRAKKAGAALKQFLVKHMKSDDIKIGKYLNELIWQRGIRSPPHSVKINVVKDDKGLVKAELIGKPIEDVAKKPEAKEEKKKEAKTEEKKEEKKEAKPEEKKTEEVKEEVKTEIKKEEKIEEKKETKAEETKKEPEKVPTAAELAAKKK